MMHAGPNKLKQKMTVFEIKFQFVRDSSIPPYFARLSNLGSVDRISSNK